jgi:hypothetical protein
MPRQTLRRERLKAPLLNPNGRLLGWTLIARAASKQAYGRKYSAIFCSERPQSGGLSIDRSTYDPNGRSKSPAGLPELHIGRTPPPPVELPNTHSRKRSIA